MCTALLVFSGCIGENETNDPKFIGSAPDPVTDYKVQSLAGGALITFKMPISDDLLYVKAEYKLASGIERSAKSSLYKNTIIVDGFANAGEYDIELYAVSKGEVSSEPTIVSITVLTPPYIETRQSIELTETFGGVSVVCENKAAADLSLVLLEKDSIGVWNEKYTHYFSNEEVSFAIRGYDTIPIDFAIFARDRWGNLSDTLVKRCTPVFEVMLDKKLWKEYKLPGDHTDPHPTYTRWTFDNMWDNSWGNEDMYHTGNSIVWPSHFTIDLGVTSKFSRFTLWQRTSSSYASNNVSLFEVYGSNDPNIDGSWESWNKIGLYEVIKPSGAPIGTVTTEDKAAAKAGHQYDLSPQTPAYRYLRFKILETWGRLSSVAITELTFWGNNEE